MNEVLAELFSSRVRAAVLTLLLPRPHLSFSLTEMSRRLNLPVSSVQHECYKLARLRLLQHERAGNVRRYRPDACFPLLTSLTAFTLSAMPLQEALAGAADGVSGLEQAWLAGDDGELSYLVAIGNLTIDQLDGLFTRVRAVLAAHGGTSRLELAFYPQAEWDRRVAACDPFAVALVNTQQIVLASAAEIPAIV